MGMVKVVTQRLNKVSWECLMDSAKHQYRKLIRQYMYKQHHFLQTTNHSQALTLLNDAQWHSPLFPRKYVCNMINRPLKEIIIIFKSVNNKTAELFLCLVDNVQPDINVGTGTWSKLNILSAETRWIRRSPNFHHE